MSVFNLHRRNAPHIFIVATLFGILSSYNITIMSGVILFLGKNFSLTAVLKEQLVSILLLGAIVGVFCAAPIADWIGRKKTVGIAAFFHIVSSLFSIYSVCVYELLMTRFVSGIGVGMISVVIPMYLAEISEPKKRGSLVSLYQLAVTIGILIAYVTNWCLASSENWHMAFFVSFVITVIGSFSLIFIPESPAWLLLKKRSGERAKDSSWKLFTKGLRRILFITILLSLFQQITGINTVIYYGPSIFQLAGFNTLSSGLLATVGIGLVNVVATVFALLWIDRLGRRKLLMSGLFGMIFSLGTLTLFFDHWGIALCSLMAYVIFFAISLGPVVFVVIAEIFPLKWRASGVSIALFVNWLANYFVSSTFITLIEMMGKKGIFLLFEGFSLLALFFVFFFVPETKGKILE